MKTSIIFIILLLAVLVGGFILGRLGTIQKPCLDEGTGSYNINCIFEMAEVIDRYDNHDLP